MVSSDESCVRWTAEWRVRYLVFYDGFLGGGLIICVGEAISPEFCNEVAFQLSSVWVRSRARDNVVLSCSHHKSDTSFLYEGIHTLAHLDRQCDDSSRSFSGFDW
jgi:hypothetical protein